MMSTSNPYNAFAEHIAYEGPLHVRVQPLQQGDAEAPQVRSLNASVLACIASVQDDVTMPEDGTTARQLARLDARLDVLTELLVRALDTDQRLPPSTHARLNALGLSCDAVPDLPADTAVRACIHFEACRGVALQLDGHIAPGAGHAFVAFAALDDATRDALDGLVFRHHRRRVARSRQQTDTAPD